MPRLKSVFCEHTQTCPYSSLKLSISGISPKERKGRTYALTLRLHYRSNHSYYTIHPVYGIRKTDENWLQDSTVTILKHPKDIWSMMKQVFKTRDYSGLSPMFDMLEEVYSRPVPQWFREWKDLLMLCDEPTVYLENKHFHGFYGPHGEWHSGGWMIVPDNAIHYTPPEEPKKKSFFK
jgi:hypothetical protein